MGGLLNHGVFVEEEGHVVDDDVVDVSEQLAGGVISEFPWSEGVEATDATNEP